MKIRTDFVTNSSSSSFTLELTFELKDGSTIAFSGMGGSPEGGASEYFRGNAIATVSPMQLGNAESVENLIDLLKKGVYDDFEDARYIFTGDTGPDPDGDLSWEEFQEFLSENEYVSDASWLIDDIRNSIHCMDDIKKIRVSGNEHNYMEYNRTFEFDRTTGEYKGIIEGEEFEKDGVSGGNLIFTDLSQCSINGNIPQDRDDGELKEGGKTEYSENTVETAGNQYRSDSNTSYVYCNVLPANYHSTYFYICDFDVKPGDIVVISIRNDSNLKAALVLEVSECTEADAPYPPDLTKHILRPFGDDEPAKLIMERTKVEEEKAVRFTKKGKLKKSRRRKDQ